MYLPQLINRLMNVKTDQYCATLSLVVNIPLLMLIFPVLAFLCQVPLPPSTPPSLHALSVSPSLQLSPPLCRLSLLWLKSRACEGWTSVSWLRIGPCCASSPASPSRPSCRRQRTSDPLTAAPLFSLPSTFLPAPLSSWCLHSPLVLCCVPVRQVLHPPFASSHCLTLSHHSLHGLLKVTLLTPPSKTFLIIFLKIEGFVLFWFGFLGHI